MILCTPYSSFMIVSTVEDLVIFGATEDTTYSSIDLKTYNRTNFIPTQVEEGNKCIGRSLLHDTLCAHVTSVNSDPKHILSLSYLSLQYGTQLSYNVLTLTLFIWEAYLQRYLSFQMCPLLCCRWWHRIQRSHRNTLQTVWHNSNCLISLL